MEPPVLNSKICYPGCITDLHLLPQARTVPHDNAVSRWKRMDLPSFKASTRLASTLMSSPAYEESMRDSLRLMFLNRGFDDAWAKPEVNVRTRGGGNHARVIGIEMVHSPGNGSSLRKGFTS